MKKRILIRLTLLAAIAVAGFLLLVWWALPPNIVSIEQVKQLSDGMSEEEVLEVLGEPSPDESDLRQIEEGRVKMAVRARAHHVPAIPPAIPSYVKEWRMEGQRLQIGFDDNGKLMMMVFIREQESICNKVRRWLRRS
jgi:hypothetical protein